jgi:hypothetical protein
MGTVQSLFLGIMKTGFAQILSKTYPRFAISLDFLCNDCARRKVPKTAF